MHVYKASYPVSVNVEILREFPILVEVVQSKMERFAKLQSIIRSIHIV
jgi:hypothetical protein